ARKDESVVAARLQPVVWILALPWQIGDSGDLLAVPEQDAVAAAHGAFLALVELDEIRGLLLGLADEHGDAQHRLRHRQDLGGTAWRALGEDEAAEVGAGLDRAVDVLLARQPANLDQWPGEELAQLCRGFVRTHQRCPYKDRVRAGELRRRRLCARVDRAFRDHDAVARRLRHELELPGAVDPERAEIARVHPDHASIETGRPPELLLVVGLHERVESELVRSAHEPGRRRVVEVAEDEECGIRSRLPQLAQVLLRREETLREQRQVGRRPRRAQVVERARERGVHEDRNGPCASGLVSRDDLLDPRSGADVTGRRRAALELGDRTEAGSGERVRESHERENSTSSSSRIAAAPESIASRACAMPSCRFAAWPAAAIPPAALRITADRCPPSAPA